MKKIDIEAERLFENSKVEDENVRKEQQKFYWSVELFINRHNQLVADSIKGLSVSICDNVVIGAGSVVTGDISVPGVYAGNPSRLISQI